MSYSVKTFVCLIAAFIGSQAVLASPSKDCVANFVLHGPVDTNFDDLTPNQWNQKVLPREWGDNGFHFFTRMKDAARAGSAGIYTPSDLQSFMMSGSLQAVPNQANRYSVQKKSGHLYQVLFDVSKTGKPCQLVTFLVTN